MAEVKETWAQGDRYNWLRWTILRNYSDRNSITSDTEVAVWISDCRKSGATVQICRLRGFNFGQCWYLRFFIVYYTGQQANSLNKRDKRTFSFFYGPQIGFYYLEITCEESWQYGEGRNFVVRQYAICTSSFET